MNRRFGLEHQFFVIQPVRNAYETLVSPTSCGVFAF